MKIYRADTADNAIQVPSKVGESHRSDELIDNTVADIFGNKNGDYFVHNTQVRTDMKGRTFKILFVEDADGDKHTLFFQLVFPLTSERNMVTYLNA